LADCNGNLVPVLERRHVGDVPVLVGQFAHVVAIDLCAPDLRFTLRKLAEQDRARIRGPDRRARQHRTIEQGWFTRVSKPPWRFGTVCGRDEPGNVICVPVDRGARFTPDDKAPIRRNRRLSIRVISISAISAPAAA
jgi:hypothetical protein